MPGAFKEVPDLKTPVTGKADRNKQQVNFSHISQITQMIVSEHVKVKIVTD